MLQNLGVFIDTNSTTQPHTFSLSAVDFEGEYTHKFFLRPSSQLLLWISLLSFYVFHYLRVARRSLTGSDVARL